MRKLTITPEAAREIVELGVRSQERSVQTIDEPLVADEYDERPIEYEAGAGITIEDETISNAGVVALRVAQSTSRTGTIDFNEQHFEWGRSTGSGAYGMCIKSDLLRTPSITATLNDNELTLTLEC